MSTTTYWRKEQSVVLPNLEVLSVNGKDVGMIQKPRDGRTGKSAWRCWIGTGDNAKSIGHEWEKAMAKDRVERAANP